MAILKAISTAQLQTFQHVLQELEAEGSMSLSAARVKTHAEITLRQAELMKQKLEQRKSEIKARRPIETSRQICKKCGEAAVIAYPVNISPATMVDGKYTAVLLCRNCHAEEWV